MIRNVVVGRLRASADSDQADADAAQLGDGLAGIAALNLPGLLMHHSGIDLTLREGGWSFAITNDWLDADSYRVYDLDAEHNVHRARIAEVCDHIARVQFEM